MPQGIEEEVRAVLAKYSQTYFLVMKGKEGREGGETISGDVIQIEREEEMEGGIEREGERGEYVPCEARGAVD